MKTIALIGSHSHLTTGLLTGLLSSKTNGIVIIGGQPKKEEVYNLVPNRLDFDLDTEPVIIPNHSFKAVQKRNAFFNRRK